MNRAIALVCAAGAAASLACSASGQVINWNNAAGGLWNDAANWSPTTVPDGPGFSAVIDLPGSYVVSFSSLAVELDAFDLLNPDAVLELGALGTLQIDQPGTMTNNGIIALNRSTSGFDAILRLQAPTTIAGSGLIELAGGLNDSQILVNADTTNAVGHTIIGAGTIQGSAVFINDSLVRAEDVGFGGDLTISAATINSGTLEAIATGELILSTPAMDNTGGEIVADGGLVRLSGTNVIAGGTLRNAGTPGSEIRRLSGITTLDDVTIEGTVEMDVLSTFEVSAGGLTNDGTIVVNNSTSGFDAIIRAVDPTVIDGTGSILLGGGGNDSQITSLAGATLTNAADHTIRGVGEITAELVNDGLVVAEVPPVDLATVLTLRVSPMTNNAAMRGDAGATLSVNGITLTQSPSATITAADGGLVLLDGGGTSIVGGTIDAEGSGSVRLDGGTTATLDGVTLDAPTVVDVLATLAIANDLTNNSLIQLNPSTSGFDAILLATDNSTLLGTGVVELSGGTNDAQIRTDDTVSAVLTNSATHAIVGAGEISGTIVNEGLIQASDTGFGAEMTLLGNDKVNVGTITSSTGATLTIAATNIDNTGGSIIADGGPVQLTSTNTIVGGVLTSSNGGEFRRLGGPTTLDGVTLDTDLIVDPTGTIIAGGAGFANNATIVLNDTISGFDALLSLADGATISGDGTIFLAGGGNDSQVAAPFGETGTIGDNQDIIGNGQLAGQLVIEGDIAPGDADGEIGLIDGPGTLTLAPSAVLEIELGDSNASDRLGVAVIEQGGTLDLEVLPGVTSALGDSYTIITHTSGGLTGAFDVVNEPAAPGGLVWKFDERPTELRYVLTCRADLSSASSPGSPDFVLTGADFFEFLALFQAGDLRIDFSSASNPGVPDGVLTGADFFAFLSLFSAGCN